MQGKGLSGNILMCKRLLMTSTFLWKPSFDRHVFVSCEFLTQITIAYQKKQT